MFTVVRKDKVDPPESVDGKVCRRQGASVSWSGAERLLERQAHSAFPEDE